MARNSGEVIIHQVLHGYRHGHKLLACSIELSEDQERSMLTLSDYSGSGTEIGFSSYITGYPLPISEKTNYYVLAKTWYAEEMKRPGCVWTHSLLIELSDLLEIKNAEVLLNLFQRPKQHHSQVDQYLQSIPFAVHSDNYQGKSNRYFHRISCELYSNDKNGLVLLADSSSQYEEAILEIWNWQWPRMKRTFKFSTGSLSLRSYSNETFDLQILPYRRKKSLSISDEDTVRIVDLDKVNCVAGWLDDYKTVNLSALQDFMIKYGSDVKANGENFVSLLKSYVLFNKNPSIKLKEIESFFEGNFRAPDEAKALKEHLVETGFNDNSKDKFGILQLIISNESFSEIDWNFSEMIISALDNKIISRSQTALLVKILLKRKLHRDLISTIKNLSPSIWIESNIDPKFYLKILKASPKLESSHSHWKLGKEFGQNWFEALKNNSKTNWANVASAMLKANSGDFVYELQQEFGSDLVSSITKWLSSSGDKKLSVSWKKIVRENQEAFFRAACNESKITKPLLATVLEILSPIEKFWRKIPTDSIKNFLTKIEKSKIETESTGIYTFFTTACYENNLQEPESINALIFQNLHNRLKDNILDFDSWESFKWRMGKDVYELIDQDFMSKLWHDRNRIPDWDRCEFLRRSLIAALLKYKWDPMRIFSEIKDEETFEMLVQFSIQISEGLAMMRHVKRNLKDSNTNSFHQKILKELVH